jgi:hypothetical protein
LQPCGRTVVVLEVARMITKFLNKFSGVFRSLSKIKFPEGGLVYDYYWSVEENKWASWVNKIPNYEHTD